MCTYCDYESDDNIIFHDFPYTKTDWYMEIQTGEWDSYEDEYIRKKVYINYCPFCGRELK